MLKLTSLPYEPSQSTGHHGRWHDRSMSQPHSSRLPRRDKDVVGTSKGLTFGDLVVAEALQHTQPQHKWRHSSINL